MYDTEEQISELEDRGGDITQAKKKKEKRLLKNKDSLRDLWDNIKCAGGPRKRKRKGQRTYLKT